MRSTALLRFGRVAPRKVRVVAQLIRGQSVGDAVNALMFCDKGASDVMKRLLISAIANADDKSSGKVNTDSLVVRTVDVDEGPVLKRWRPRAMGRASRIIKRSSHIRIVLEDGSAEPTS